jgi:hypothetical protein
MLNWLRLAQVAKPPRSKPACFDRLQWVDCGPL